MSMVIPVITVDGPSGSGKGTLSQSLAHYLGWHFLDSGALYRVLAFAALHYSIALDDIESLEDLSKTLEVRFEHGRVFFEAQEITQEIRTEGCGGVASQIAQLAGVRQGLLERQRAFLLPPGLVADGRDMGTVVFPSAKLKLFLEATALERAKRRQLELKKLNMGVSLEGLLAEIEKRDVRDKHRALSPLVPAEDAWVIDTTFLSREQVFEVALQRVRDAGLYHGAV